MKKTLLLAMMVTLLGACSPAGMTPIKTTLITPGGTIHYDSKGGLAVTVDTRSGK
jgi:hypothetical protein